MKKKLTFEDIYEQNRRRFRYHSQKIINHNLYQHSFQMELVSLWAREEKHRVNSGLMATYFNYIIRNRLSQLVQAESTCGETSPENTSTIV